MPFVALLLLQRRPVAGRALLVNGPGCPGNSLCRANVHEQTRKQVALLNATAQDLFSLYVSDTSGDGAWGGGDTVGWPSCGMSRWPGGTPGAVGRREGGWVPGVTLASPPS